MTNRIVVLDGLTLNPGDLSWNDFNELGETTIYDYTNLEDTVDRIGDSNIVLTNKTILTSSIMERCPKLEYIGVLATGYDVVDIKAAKQLGIKVANVPAYGTDSVAQHTIALILELSNQVGYHSAKVKDGEWSKRKTWTFWDKPLIELSGKTLGIIGYGRIGKKVGEIAKAIGMNIITDSIIDYDFNQLLESSDIISLHCPLKEDTHNLVNSETISKMKDGVILINTSRGALINENDLYDGLTSGKISYAALDVLSNEPPAVDNKLLDLDNCIITPHISWSTIEARGRIMKISKDNISNYLNGDDYNGVVE